MKADTEAVEHPETHRLGLGPAPTGACGPRTECPGGVATARLKESRYSFRRPPCRRIVACSSTGLPNDLKREEPPNSGQISRTETALVTRRGDGQPQATPPAATAGGAQACKPATRLAFSEPIGALHSGSTPTKQPAPPARGAPGDRCQALIQRTPAGIGHQPEHSMVLSVRTPHECCPPAETVVKPPEGTAGSPAGDSSSGSVAVSGSVSTGDSPSVSAPGSVDDVSGVGDGAGTGSASTWATVVVGAG